MIGQSKLSAISLLVIGILVVVSVYHTRMRRRGCLGVPAGDVDQILNISGMSVLVVGAFLFLWDWAWFAAGGVEQYFLGFSHLVISLWAVVIEAIGLKKILGVPIWLGRILSFLGIPTDESLRVHPLIGLATR